MTDVLSGSDGNASPLDMRSIWMEMVIFVLGGTHVERGVSVWEYRGKKCRKRMQRMKTSFHKQIPMLLTALVIR